MYCSCLLWILPVWIILMGLVILTRYLNPKYKLHREEIVELVLSEKYNEAKKIFQNFHKLNGPRHSLARMVQQDLQKRKNNKYAKDIFEYLYQNKKLPD